MTAELVEVSVERQRRRVLADVSLACEAGAITAFCGPNGAGKTTALSVLSGGLAARSGDVTLDGVALRRRRADALARRRAVVSQISTLNFPFDVHEVVAMGRTPHFGRAAPDADARAIAAAMRAMDLEPLATRNFLTLSGGERQRVNIARALAQVWPDAPDGAPSRGDAGGEAGGETGEQRPWLFLDEPTSALDLKHELALMTLLRRLRRDGWGIVIVLHDLHLVRRFADAAGFFKDGRLVAFGPAVDVVTETSVQDVFDLDAPYPLERAAPGSDPDSDPGSDHDVVA
ncbi:MAG: ATP-binding cassette domain-containing protein [Pseudomonadota bacterium]